jgi:hypothetical protein
LNERNEKKEEIPNSASVGKINFSFSDCGFLYSSRKTTEKPSKRKGENKKNYNKNIYMVCLQLDLKI